MNGTSGSFPPAHAHSYYAVTATAEAHRHEIYGFTYPVNGRASDKHVHTFQGFSEMSRGHSHRYYGTTGPAIPLADGSHIHAVSGNTNRNYLQPAKVAIAGQEYTEGVQYSPGEQPVHFHSYSGKSSTPIGTEPPDW